MRFFNEVAKRLKSRKSEQTLRSYLKYRLIETDQHVFGCHIRRSIEELNSEGYSLKDRWYLLNLMDSLSIANKYLSSDNYCNLVKLSSSYPEDVIDTGGNWAKYQEVQDYWKGLEFPTSISRKVRDEEGDTSDEFVLLQCLTLCDHMVTLSEFGQEISVGLEDRNLDLWRKEHKEVETSQPASSEYEHPVVHEDLDDYCPAYACHRAEQYEESLRDMHEYAKKVADIPSYEQVGSFRRLVEAHADPDDFSKRVSLAPYMSVEEIDECMLKHESMTKDVQAMWYGPSVYLDESEEDQLDDESGEYYFGGLITS